MGREVGEDEGKRWGEILEGEKARGLREEMYL